jgi:predicted adenine nucleotide alpha hydrolase (AANH) superfamily ATPase
MRLLLHACCAPCLLEPLDELAEDVDDLAVVYANPNIQPYDEYRRRLSTLRRYADATGVVVHETEYDPGRWIQAVAGALDDPAARCRTCYALRMAETARLAGELGFDAIATTLTVSPYQDIDAIHEEGGRAAHAVGIGYERRDFRDRYDRAVQRSRELGMYRQNYCGCVLSDVEARRERAARRDARRAARGAGDA